MARMTGFEPATSGVTGRRSKPLSYTPARRFIMASGEGGMQAGVKVSEVTEVTNVTEVIEGQRVRGRMGRNPIG